MSSSNPTNKSERDKKYRARTNTYMGWIGPLTTRLFSKMQTLLGFCNENERYAVLYNMLVMWKEMDEKEDE